MRSRYRLQTGFGMIAAIVVLVILSTLAAAIVALSTTQSAVLAQDVLSARATLTARAGVEWGLFQAFSKATAWGGSSCEGNVPVSVDMPAINGFQATVTCSSVSYPEGESSTGVAQTIRIYRILSVACPGAPCPQPGSAAAATSYVERRREAIGI